MTPRVKAHLWTLPRWFAAPFFGSAVVFGALLAGGMSLSSWLGVITGLLIMAGGHSFNSLLDYAWTGLDKGETGERSAEKDYCAGQSLLAAGIVTVKEVALNAIIWYVLAAIPLVYLARHVTWAVLPVGLAGMLVTFWYARAKFNWTHELALAVGCGPLAVLLGMCSTAARPAWHHGILASVPFAIMLSFAGLALDEWPDAEANLRKGVKSVAYKVWESGVTLEWYLTSWFLFMFIYQVLLISVGIVAPLTALSFLAWPFLIGTLVVFKKNFPKMAPLIVVFGATYVVLIAIGQYLGR
ncbi:MAG TPA: prenyltransferase [bacterium]|nr:prenyltransferase [bacterium]